MDEQTITQLLWELLDGNQQRSTMKMVVLGHGQIGKSTLVNYLKYCTTNTPSASWFNVRFSVMFKCLICTYYLI